MRILLLVISVVSIGCNSPKYSDTIPFESTQWKKSNSTTRIRMYEDLFANHKQKIIGHHREEIISLLGQPDLDSAIYSSDSGFTMIYSITDSTYSECPCNLDIVFDSTGIVTYMSWRDM